MKKAWYLIFVLLCFSTNVLISQTDSIAPLNMEFLNGYADKLHMTPAERNEFITAHQKIHAERKAAAAKPIQQTQSGSKVIGDPNTTFAGPCVNADFEANSTAGWVRTWGYNPGFTLTPACCPTPGGAQTIMSGGGNDPYGGFPVVEPSGNFSLRLGNNGTGGVADQIEQTFMVSAANANFSYKYAVVFEDPNHTIAEQPYFEISLVDQFNVPIPCTFYHVAAGAGIPGFFNSSTAGVIYKPWSTVLVDLTPFIGQNITIRFATFDCSLGGHFGYAYIDGVCQSFSSGGSSTVCVGTSTTFCAPTGVQSYTWNGPGVTNFIGQCATATAAGIYTVSTTLFTGCPGPTFTYTLVTQAPPVASAAPNTTICANDVLIVGGSITGFTASPKWSASGGGVFSSTAAINPTFTPSAANKAAGSATLTLTTINNGVCPASISTLVVAITPSPVVNAGTGGSVCNSDPFALNGTVTGASTTGSWTTTGDGNFSPADNVLTATYTPGAADIAAGSVTLTLSSTNNGICPAVSDTVNLLIRKLPTANAGANQLICSGTPTIALAGIIGGGSSTGAWSSSGIGALTPATPVLNKMYALTAADIAFGSVTFTLTSTNNGPCPAAQDSVLMPIVNMATVSAGPNLYVCSNASTLNLAGTINSPSNTVNWGTGGTGSFLPNTTTTNATYSFSPADITAGTVIFTLSSTNNGVCPTVNDTVKMRIMRLASVSAGTNQVLCSNTGAVNLTGTVTGAAGTAIWSASGPGAFTPLNTSLNTSYSITPFDINDGAVVFTLTSTNNGPCPVVTSNVELTITNLATVTAGPNLYVCSNASTLNLAGTINSPSNTVNWGSNGTGSFLPNTTTTNATYSFSPADITAGTVIFTLSSTNNGVCPAVNDTVKMRIMRLAAISSGTNQVLCSNISAVNVNGTVTGAAGTGIWSASGPGAFTPLNTSLNTSYSITPADIGAGQVVFTLSSTNNGPCPVVTSTVGLTITNLATVSAGPNLYVCSNASTLNLAGTINSPSNTVNWGTNGTGSFLPNTTTTNATYSFSPADITAGTVIFTLTSTNNGVCPAVNDTVKMRIMRLASVSAGTNQALCSNISAVNLNGTVTGAAGTVIWSASGPGAFGTNTALNTSYSITPADIAAGTVIFTLSSTNNGPCPIVTSTVALAISKIATVTAGANQFVCSSQNSIALSGTVSGVTSTGQWGTAGAGGFSPANNSLATAYALTANDISNGTVIFTLTSTSNSVCPAVSDTVLMKVMKQATVNAGLNQALCSNISTLALSGTITGVGGSGNWFASGPGVFVPTNTLLATAYSITPADISAGMVIFTLSSTGNGPCPVISDTVKITLQLLATVNAGVNQLVCSSQNTIAVNGSITGATTSGQWASSSFGSFSPNNITPGYYNLSPFDIASGVVVFTLSSTNNSVCPVVRDTVLMKIMKQATVNAGFNQALCSNISTLSLSGTVAGVGGTGAWSASGPGVFVPTNTLLTTAYSITPADISAGQVIFTLSSTGNGPCPVISDTVKVTLQLLATVNAGINQFVCSSQNTIAVNGTITGATTSGQWVSSSFGTFSPNNATSSYYNLSAFDIANGVVMFTLSSTSNSVCPVVRDTVLMKIKRVPIVNAGPNLVICTTQANIALTGTVNGGGNTGGWTSSGGGAFLPNANILNPSYVISPQDISAGMLTLTLTSQNSAPCPEVKDTTAMIIRTPAQVVSGTSQTICSNSGSINLSGSVTGGLGTVSWTSNGTGNFNPGNTLPVTAYVISPADIASGVVNFTLASTNNGSCVQSISKLSTVIKEIAHVNAGADKSICSNQLSVPLQGTITGVTNAGSWTANGTGTFIPNQPIGTYTASAADVAQGSLAFVLTSSNNDVCPAVSDTMKVTIVIRPSITVSHDTIVCEQQSLISLSGSINGGSVSPQWTTTGSGIFLPTNAITATHYSLSAGDKATGNVALSLGFSSTGPCGYTGSPMQVTILPGAHAAFTLSSYTIHLPGGPVQFNNSSVSASTYTWTFGDGGNSVLTDPTHNYNTVGFYNTVLIAKNAGGCSDTTEQQITVVRDVKAPTAFTPNTHGSNGGQFDSKNDLSNDVFFPYTEGVVECDLMIFNRWGELLFRSKDVNIGWDGYFNGKLCQQDVYVWKANFVFFDGSKYNQVGSITLLR